MPWRWLFTHRAERDLAHLPVQDREAVRRVLDGAAENLAAADLKKLEGRPGEWRLRVGRWRVIPELDNPAGLITVTRVLPRGRAYRD